MAGHCVDGLYRAAGRGAGPGALVAACAKCRKALFHVARSVTVHQARHAAQLILSNIVQGGGAAACTTVDRDLGAASVYEMPIVVGSGRNDLLE